jgi:CspA family cold shock protein
VTLEALAGNGESKERRRIEIHVRRRLIENRALKSRVQFGKSGAESGSKGDRKFLGSPAAGACRACVVLIGPDRHTGGAGHAGGFFLAQCRDRRSTMLVIARESDVASGTVKWFNPTKGYGFIQPDTGGKDVFVHISAVEKAGLNDLREGDKVKYDIISDRGKESAGNLQVK